MTIILAAFAASFPFPLYLFLPLLCSALLCSSTNATTYERKVKEEEKKTLLAKIEPTTVSPQSLPRRRC